MVPRDYFIDDVNQLLLLLLIEQEGNASAKTFGERLTLWSNVFGKEKFDVTQ
jgi:hypothetical protein